MSNESTSSSMTSSTTSESSSPRTASSRSLHEAESSDGGSNGARTSDHASGSNSGDVGEDQTQLVRQRYDLERRIIACPSDAAPLRALARILRNEVFDEALVSKRLLERAIRLEPHNVQNFLDIADLLQDDLGEYELAIEYLTRALDADPRNPNVTFRLAKILQHHTQNYRLAKHLYRITIRLEPNNSDACFNLALLLENDEYARSSAVARRDSTEGYGRALGGCALVSSSSSTEDDGELIRACVGGEARSGPNVPRSRMDQARDLYRRALELDPENSEARGNLVGLLEDHYRDADAARKVWEDALHIDPEDQEALFNLASMARQQAESQRARELFRRLDRAQRRVLHPSQPVTPATPFHSVGIDAARAVNEDSIAPSVSGVREALPARGAPQEAQLLQRSCSGESLRARRMLEEALRLDPTQQRSRMVLATLLLESFKETEAAVAQLNHIIADDPEHVAAMFMLANLWSDDVDGSCTEACALYEKVLEIDPNHVGVLNNFSILCEKRLRDHERAISLYERAIYLFDNGAALPSPDVFSNLAWLLMEHSAAAEDMASTQARALHCFERALEIDPHNPHAIIGLRQLRSQKMSPSLVHEPNRSH